MGMNTKLVLICITALALTVSGCVMQETPNDQNSQIANPASTYCVEQGGDVVIYDVPGGQQGYCKFPNGWECEEWEFFRSEGQTCNK